MKTFEIGLPKSYIVRVQAEDEEAAKASVEYFTGDIQNISTAEDEVKHNFKIENIDCTVNEAFDAIEIDDLHVDIINN